MATPQKIDFRESDVISRALVDFNLRNVLLQTGNANKLLRLAMINIFPYDNVKLK